ncbi:MAG: hypothetical protein JNM46_08075 [Anaerolineales bacterium]|nr:hypothetical protein [Anaerolineales bacterium]
MTFVLNKRLLLAWFLSLPISYVLIGFLDYFYQSLYEILFLAILLHALTSLFVYYLIGRIKNYLKLKPTESWITTFLFLALIIFLLYLTKTANRFSLLFDPAFYQIQSNSLIWFALGIIIAFPCSVWLLSFAHSKEFHKTRFFTFIDKNLSGILLSLAFFAIYFLLSNIFNQPLFNFDDIFFDTDAKLYRARFGTENYEDVYWRTVHPFILIVVRPWANIISLFLKGNLLYASFVLIALTGALAVFLVWYFVKETTGNSLYALLIASLFGASTSQLVFGSIIESYGFLGTVALIFIVLLLKNAPPWTLVITGLAAFGITISNIAQTVIAHFMVKRDFWQLVKYGLIVGSLIIPLNLLNNFIYPDAHPYLWDVSTLQYEEKNVFSPTPQRAYYLARVMVLNSVVAPYPILYKEDIPFIKIWMFLATTKGVLRVAEYKDVLSSFVVYAWAGLMLLGGTLFLKNIKKQDNRFLFAFILITLFSFALHLRYGRDVFLYSSNWMYALILFLALAWKELANKLWFQITLLAFVVMLLINNSKLIEIMMTVSVLHIK